MNITNVLIIEDDPVINNQLAELLAKEGYSIEQCFDGETGLEAAISQQHQLILMDVMLPVRDGYSLLGILRKTSQVPVIMLTAKGAEEERIKGLSQGADDYIAKPFNTTELCLRIEAILRRSAPKTEQEQLEKLSYEGLVIHRALREATANGQLLELTPTQFKLLWYMLLHRGDTLSKAYLYPIILNRSFGQHDRSLDMHLSRVRRKLHDAHWPGERLQTVHGKGYCLV